MISYPLYRLHNGRDHFYTTNWNEVIFATSMGYNYEGIACWVKPTD
ncbi:MAG: hypothetical protein AB1466_04140 [Actinomycetota bacterium]